MKHRSFISIIPPPSSRQRLASLQSVIGGHVGHIRWEREEKLHITLQFLGDREEAWLKDLAAEVTELVRRTDAFEVAVTSVGCFPNRYSPKIVWVGSSREENPALVGLADGIREASRRLGLVPEEKEFQPHITLGRGKGKATPDLTHTLETLTFHPEVFSCSHLHIMKSTLAASGSLHTPLFTIPLNH